MTFIFPPLIFCGIVSPLIIQLLSEKADMVGRAAGTIYAISTVGGILFTFLSGFYLIPFIGLKASSMYMAIALGIFPVIYVFRKWLSKQDKSAI